MFHRATHPLLLAALIALAGTAGAQQPSGAAVQATAGKPATATPLGDLSPFRTIAADTLRIIDTGDLAAAKKRIKDLEVSWDQAEPRIKPKAPQQWETVDVAIDRALKEVRAWSTTQAKSAEALQALLATIDSMK
jgi:hypothetical protein